MVTPLPALETPRLSLQPSTPKYYVEYMAFMLSSFFALKDVGTPQLIVGITAMVAMLALLGIATWQLLGSRHDEVSGAHHERPLITVALIAFCLLFCMATAYGRLCGGLWTARASRYVIYMELGVLGVYFQLLNIRLPVVRQTLLAGLLIAVIAASSYVDRVDMANFSRIKLQWKRCYFLTGDPALCNRVADFPIYTSSLEGRHLQEKLDFLKATRQNLYSDAK